jgi:putative transposase
MFPGLLLVLGTIAEPTGTDGLRPLSHQCWSTSIHPLVSSIKSSNNCFNTIRLNAICERFLGSVRRECLDHLLILHEKQLQRVLGAYVHYFNQARPHQGIRQQIPEPNVVPIPSDHEGGKVLSFPVLGGLHHDYRSSA